VTTTVETTGETLNLPGRGNRADAELVGR
jgi:hypothetical protein